MTGLETPSKPLILSPGQYADAGVYDLLMAASLGHAGLDLRWVRAILAHGQDAVPDLIRFASERHEGAPIILEEDLIALFRALRAKEALPYLVGIIREQPDEVPDDVLAALVDIGEPALDPLLHLYEELDAEDNDIPFVLASIGVHQPRVLDLLIERLTYDPMDAAMCLALYGDPAAKSHLEKALAEIPDSETDVKTEIRRALEDLENPPGERILDKFDIESIYPEQASPAWDVLSEAELFAFLSSPEQAYRIGVLNALARREPSRAAVARLTVAARTDTDADVRAAAWEGLAGPAADDEKLRTQIAAVVENETAPIAERKGALIALAQQPDVDAHRWLTEFYSIEEARAAALEGMWRSLDARYADYFSRHLDDPDVDLRREALWGVGHLRLQSAASTMRSLFLDERFRDDALFNYAMLWPGEISRSRARNLLRKIEDAADGLSDSETQIVQAGIDQRLVMSGMKTVFASADDFDAEAPVKEPAGRNDPCPCGSGKKYKKCCGA